MWKKRKQKSTEQNLSRCSKPSKQGRRLSLPWQYSWIPSVRAWLPACRRTCDESRRQRASFLASRSRELQAASCDTPTPPSLSSPIPSTNLHHLKLRHNSASLLVQEAWLVSYNTATFDCSVLSRTASITKMLRETKNAGAYSWRGSCKGRGAPALNSANIGLYIGSRVRNIPTTIIVRCLESTEERF